MAEPTDTDYFDSLMEQWVEQRARITQLERERGELVEALRRIGNPRIGHNDSSDPEELACPVCRLRTSHARLVEALSLLLRTGDDCSRHPLLASQWEAWKSVRNQARSALAKAGAP